ncbi:MAG: carbohydrate ABC transporter substrate-binding protein [Ruminococcaceae bacterium]|nr:carbohydrate ABC transporter substrate-binding protein [Oscillospiraceae bacterium]
MNIRIITNGKKFILLMFIFLFSLIGCSPSRHSSDTVNSSEEKTVDSTGNISENDLMLPGEGWIIKLYANSTYKTILESIEERFLQKYPGASLQIVDLSNLSDNDYRTRLATDLAAGNGPDVILTDAIDMTNLTRLISNGALSDLNQMNKDFGNVNWSDYHEAVCSMGIIEEKRYLVPLSYSIGLLLSSEERLNKAGIRYENTDLETFCDDINRYLIANPDKIVFEQYWEAVDFLERFDAYTQDASRSVYDCWKKLFPGIFGGVEAVKHYNIYYRLGQYDNSIWNVFAAGDILFLNTPINRGTIYETLYGNNSRYNNILSLGEKPVFMTVPTLDNAPTRATISCLAAVPTAASRKGASIAFLEYLLSMDGQYHVARSLGIPVSHEFTEHMLNIYRTNSWDNNEEYYLPAFVKFDADVLDWYEKTIQNVQPTSLIDGNMKSIWSSALRPYVQDKTEDFQTCYNEVMNKLKIYNDE